MKRIITAAAVSALALTAVPAHASDGLGMITRNELRLANSWLRAVEDGVERRPTKRLVEHTYDAVSIEEMGAGSGDPMLIALYQYPGPKTAEFTYREGRLGRYRLVAARTIRLG